MGGHDRQSEGAGVLCLQGGREFTAGCRDMDRHVLDLAGAGPVAVLAGAARVGSDYRGASQRALTHYEDLGATVRTVPDPREDARAAQEALDDDVALVVLPGGSPASLLGVLTDPSTGVGERLLELHAAGVAISGASAGAMVLCEQLVVPDRRPPTVTAGLGLVAGLALVHWSPDGDRGWPTGDVSVVWGLPECGGIVVDGERLVAVGRGEPSQRIDGRWTPVARS